MKLRWYRSTAMALSITLVTPSFNQAAFLSRTIESVLGQNYPHLEYMIIDGGSTDGSVDIIRQYAGRLAYWTSEPDRGQAHAVNKGLQRGTGEIVGWLNSDDTLAPGALHAIAEAYARRPDVDLVYGHTCVIDAEDRVVRRLCAVPTNADELIRYNLNIWSQPGTTWRRRLHERVGYLDESLHYLMDGEFWVRAARAGRIQFLPRHLGNLRVHEQTKTARHAEAMEAERRQVLERFGAPDVRPWERRLWRIRRLLRIATNPATIRYRFFGGH